MTVQRFYVGGMACAACQSHVQEAVAKLDGVRDVTVSLLTKEMTVQYDDGKVTEKSICKAVRKLGFTIDAQADPVREEKKLCRRLLFRFLFSLLFLLPLMYAAMPGLPQIAALKESPAAAALVQFVLLLPVLVLNRGYFRNGLLRLAHWKPDMESLIALGSGAGVLYSLFITGRIVLSRSAELLPELSFEAAGMILTIVTLGKYLEMRSRGKTGNAVAKLMALSPKKTMVERDGKEITIPLSELQTGDIVVLRGGSAVPADGAVISGHAVFDQSAVTGESVPVEKMTGMSVISGTFCTDGLLKFKAEKTGADSTLEKMIQCVRNAAAEKAPVARLADRVSAVFVPLVLLIALGTFAFWLWNGSGMGTALECAVAVLVISCPCALGLAAPVAVMTGTGRGAELGMLFKNAVSLETLCKIRTAVFDKTGTLTSGEPSVSGIVCGEGVTAEQLLSAAVLIEQPSRHPYAKAVCRYGINAGNHMTEGREVTDFRTVPGQGVRGKYDGKELFAGNVALLRSLGLTDHFLEQKAEEMANDGKTPLFFGESGKVLGLLGLADTIRPGAAEAVRQLKKMKIKTVLLTGDNRRTALYTAKQIGIEPDCVYAEVLPSDKENVIRQIQTQTGKKAAMIGDGINDAPALARADVGIAIGAGTDIALETADVVLAQNDPRNVADAVRLSRAVLANIRMNLFWGLFYNVIGIPFAAGVFYPLLGWYLPPMYGAAAMSLSSVCVVLNALRLKRFRKMTEV